MAISNIGSGIVEATTITIPGTYQTGDLIIMMAFRGGSTSGVTQPAGWTTLIGNISSGSSSRRLGWKLATSSSDTSGTWTSATGLICAVYRGIATNKTPIMVDASAIGNGSTGTTVSYSTITTATPGLTQAGAWIGAMGAHRSLDTALETPPTNSGIPSNALSLRLDTVGAVGEYVVFDSIGSYMGKYSPNGVSVGGTSADWATCTFAMIPESLAPINNFQFPKASDNGNGVMSVSEKIR